MRHVRAGDTRFIEQVSLQPMQAIHTCTAANDQQIHAESITSIEEPASGYLFVRFIYRRELPEDADLQLLGEHLKSAYRQLDIDAIALIRLLAEEEYLNTLLH